MATSLTDIVVAIVVGVVGSLLAAEIGSHASRITESLIRRAGRKLPDDDRQRFTEEWLAHADQLVGGLSKLKHGFACYLKAAPAIRRFRRRPLWSRKITAAFVTTYTWAHLARTIVPVLIRLVRTGRGKTAQAYFLSSRIMVKTLVLEMVYRRSDSATVDAAMRRCVNDLAEVLGVKAELTKALEERDRSAAQ